MTLQQFFSGIGGAYYLHDYKNYAQKTDKLTFLLAK